MKNKKLNFEDFKNEKLSTNQQKTVRGGDTEPGRANGAGSLQPQTARKIPGGDDTLQN